MHSHVKHDIKLDDAIKKQDKQLISQMKEEHENSIILELKDSLDDDTVLLFLFLVEVKQKNNDLLIRLKILE